MAQLDAETEARRLAGMRLAHQRYLYIFDDEAPPDLAFAYEVQDRFVARLGLAGSPAGYKVGATTPRMQARLGLDQPMSGIVLADTVHASPAVLRQSEIGPVGMECEIGFRVGRELPADGPGLSDPAFIAAHMDSVCAVFELLAGSVEPGTPGRPASAASMVAINVWNGGLVLGPEIPASSIGDYSALRCVLYDADGNVADRGVSSDILGNPLLVVGWLAGHLARSGRRLEAGQIVSTGSTTAPREVVQPGQSYRFVVDGLPPVEMSVV